MQEFKTIGGARIGWFAATWPFAKLSVSSAHLRLSGILGTHEFVPRDVVSLQYHRSMIPFFQGIQIVHIRSDYPSTIGFGCCGRPEKLRGGIRDCGFLPKAPANSVAKA